MKNTIRKKYLTIRNNITNREELDNSIFKKLINNKIVNNSTLILIYVSTNSEVNTLNLIEHFLKEKHVAVPKIENNIMNFYIINSLNDLSPGYFNILEPTTKEKVTNYNNCISITPGIAFSRDLYRIGYGKGFYDKFYENHKDIYKIGLTYDECLLDTLPTDKYDIPLDEIITPTRILVKK